MSYRNYTLFARLYILICVLYSLWGFLVAHIISGNILVYLMALIFFGGFIVCFAKYQTLGKKNGVLFGLWLFFFVYTLARYCFAFQIQWLTYWLPCLAALFMARKAQIENCVPYNLLVYSAFFALSGIFFQLLFPGPYYSRIAPFLSVGQDVGISDWVEEGHGYAGFTYQLGVTAIILTMGISVFFSFREKYIKQMKPIIYYILLVSLILGVFLSGKRMLMAVDVVVPGIIILINRGNRKLFLLLPFAGIAIYLMYGWFMSHLGALADSAVLGRLATSVIDSQSGQSAFNTREGLYISALAAFSDNPLWGINDFKVYTGLDTDVHNAYLQVLCERGIIGFILFVTPIIVTLMKTLKLFFHNKNKHYDSYIQFSLFLQLAYIIYSFTGNTTIDMSCYLMYFIAVAVLLSINYSIETQKRFDNKLL